VDSQVPDEELVRRYLAGDAGAFSDLVRRHETRVYNVAYRMLGRPDDARDAAQETFLSCVRKLRGFQARSAFTTWLYRVTVNVCYDILRRRARDPISVEEVPERPGLGADPAEGAIARVDVQRALVRVPEDFRTVLVLHDVHDLGYEQIAAIIGAPIGTVKSRLHRGRLALARLLGEGEPAAAPGPSKGREEEET
jgi:RNA polymerase sigma-70 factor (ECF subfamily)